MAEEKSVNFNPNYMLDPKKHKKLLAEAQDVFNDPSSISEKNILEISPENPALASKVLLSAYTRALHKEAVSFDSPDKETILQEIHDKYKVFLDEFKSKNRELASSPSSIKQTGGKQQ